MNSPLLHQEHSATFLDHCSMYSKLFPDHAVDKTYAEAIARAKDVFQSRKLVEKSRVVILGGGPAGLMRAIISMMNGNPTTVIEKRSEKAKCRDNVVVLTKSTVAMLKFYGIYQILLSDGLIYPENANKKVTARLGDLEYAMKKVMHDLGMAHTIRYETTIKKIDDFVDGFTLFTGGDDDHKIEADVIVNCEGANSTTNKLMEIDRIEVQEKVPVIAAIYKDDRPAVKGPCSLVVYVAKTIKEIVVTIFYHIKFVFMAFVTRSVRQQIQTALTFHVPGQAYLGALLKPKVMEGAQKFQKILESKTASKEEKEKAQKQLKSYLRPYLISGICFSNFLYFVAGFWKMKNPEVRFTKVRALDQVSIVNIGADKASSISLRNGKGIFMLAGDAAATVDPVTGLGCNSALQSAADFHDYLLRIETGTYHDAEDIYGFRMNRRVEFIHEQSEYVRKRYMPSAI